MWRHSTLEREKQTVALPPLFSSIRQVLLAFLVVRQDFVLEVLLVI